MSEADDQTRAGPARPGGRASPGPARPGHGAARPGPAARAGGEQARPGHEAGQDDAVYQFIERFSSTLAEAGFPRMPARVFVALFSSDPGVLTAAELASLLRASPAAVSGAVRYLVQVGLVSSEREPGSRRLRYRMPGDVWEQVLRMRDRLLDRWIGVLREGVQTVGPQTPAGIRMADSARYFEFMNAELPRLLDRWQEIKAAGTSPGRAGDPGPAGDAP